MTLNERLNVLIQATSLAQKNGVLTLDNAVKAKTAIDVISSGKIDQNLPLAINSLMEIVVLSQSKGAFSLKDAHMVYLALDGIEVEFQNEMNRLNSRPITPNPKPIQNPQPVVNVKQENVVKKDEPQVIHTQKREQNNTGENIVRIPPVILKNS